MPIGTQLQRSKFLFHSNIKHNKPMESESASLRYVVVVAKVNLLSNYVTYQKHQSITHTSPTCPGRALYHTYTHNVDDHGGTLKVSRISIIKSRVFLMCTCNCILDGNIFHLRQGSLRTPLRYVQPTRVTERIQ